MKINLKLSEILSENITKLMDANEHLDTFAKLGEKTGLRNATIERIKKATVSTSIDNVEVIARAFNISVAKLLSKNMEVDSVNFSKEIYDVVDAMKDIDQNGQVKMKIAAMEACELHKLHLAKLRQQTNTDLSDIERKLIESYRNSDADHQELIIVGAEEAMKASVGNLHNKLKKSG